MRDGNFLRLLLMYHTYCYGAYFFLTWFPTYLQVGRGLTEDQMKIAASLPAWFGFVGLIGGGYLERPVSANAFSAIGSLRGGAAGLIIAGICLGLATITPNNTIAVGLLTLGGGSYEHDDSGFMVDLHGPWPGTCREQFQAR